MHTYMYVFYTWNNGVGVVCMYVFMHTYYVCINVRISLYVYVLCMYYACIIYTYVCIYECIQIQINITRARLHWNVNLRRGIIHT